MSRYLLRDRIHRMAKFSVIRTYPNDRPNCEGLKRIETWTRGCSDDIDRNGPISSYEITVPENGGKIFDEVRGVSQTITSPDGSKKSTLTCVFRYTGGTGNYKGIRGAVRFTTIFDPDKNMNKIQAEGEYWLEK